MIIPKYKSISSTLDPITSALKMYKPENVKLAFLDIYSGKIAENHTSDGRNLNQRPPTPPLYTPIDIRKWCQNFKILYKNTFLSIV